MKTRINGIVLSGGEDIGIFKLRDFSENFLIKYSIKKIFGFVEACKLLDYSLNQKLFV